MSLKKNPGFVKKCRTFLTAAVMSTVLVAGQGSFTAIHASAATEAVGTMIPDSLTVSAPCALSEIALPSNEYGRLVWEDDSREASSGEHSFTVLIKPEEGVDLSDMSGWDEGRKAVVRSITVIVSSDEEDPADEESEDEYEEEADGEDEPDESGEEDTDEEESDEVDSEDEEDSEDEDVDEEDSEDEDADEEDSEDEDAEEEDSEDENAEEEDSEDEDAEEEDSEDEDAEEEDFEDEDAEGEDFEDEDAEEEDSDDEDVAEDEDTIINAVPEGVDDKDNIFDKELVASSTSKAVSFEEMTTDAEKEQASVANHTSNGIMISGANLPYYVQFRVSDAGNASFSNQEKADIFRSYEFSLWDLKNERLYEIPDGEYVSLAIPVKAGYTYTVEHLLSNGAKEMITPSVSGNLLTFSTHSLSPFGVAGSKTLVGEDVEKETYNSGSSSSGSSSSGSSSTGSSSSGSSSSRSSSSGSSSTGTGSSSSAGTGNTAVRTNSGTAVSAGSSSNNTTASAAAGTGSSSNRTTTARAVATGDDTNILPFVGLIAAALVVILLVVFLKKRGK